MLTSNLEKFASRYVFHLSFVEERDGCMDGWMDGSPVGERG